MAERGIFSAVRPVAPPGSPLSREDIQALASEARRQHRVVDLRAYELSELDLGGSKQLWEFVIFGLNSDASTSTLRHVAFRGATLKACWFAGVDLCGVDLTECELVDCDFRFACFERVRLGHATFLRCDLYGASVETGSIAEGLTFKLSSLPQFGDGITGLQWESFSGSNGVPALAAEDPDADAYRQFLRRTEHERPQNARSIDLAIDDRLIGAAGDYRRLSGYWAGQGRFQDANEAYTRSRRLERKAASPWFAYTRRRRGEGSFAKRRATLTRRTTTDASLRQKVRERSLRPLKWAGLWLADLVCRFGQSLSRVFGTLVVVAVLPGLAYTLFHGVDGSRSVWDDLLFSACRLSAYTPSSLTPATKLTEWVGVFQSSLGVALIGLFGYVLGKVLRES